MITRIKGKLTSVRDDDATLDAGVFDYQVLVPDFVRRQLQNRLGTDVSLHTVHYLEGNPAHGKLTPRLVGFLTEVEREFFEMFCSVDGVGFKKALRAMTQPVQDTAVIIEQQDAKEMRRAAHTIKGSSSHFLAQRVVAAAALLERYGEEQVFQDAQEAYEHLAEEVTRMTEIIKATFPS